MIVTCPACEAQYLLPDDAVGPKGRRVKCTSCSYTWLQPPEGGAVEDIVEAKEVAFDPEGAARRQVYDPRQMATPVVSGNSWGRIIGYGAGLAACMVAVTLGFLILFKDYAVSKWQPLVLLYGSLGLEIEAPGSDLVLENISAAADEQKGILTLKGTIVNPLKENRKLPKFLVRLSGENGWLKDWTIDLYEKTMEAGKSIGFEYGLKDAPPGGREVTLRFAD